MWRCLIIEDDIENARYVATGLKQMGHHAVICGDGLSAMRRALSESWDVIVLDRLLPNDMDGLSILSALRAMDKRTPVLVLSALTSVDERVRGLKAGGDDYLSKPFVFSELAARIEALVRRSVTTQDDKRMLQVADLQLDLVNRKVTRAGKPIDLQPREFTLLSFMAMHAEQVLTRTMLLASVWDYHFNPQTNVLDVQISRLRQKIDGPFGPPLIETVRGVGYRLTAGLQGDAHAAGEA
ncbi:response regulator transcription factor [Bordetella genomosp. 13]|uniref:response regulator transcription factor n=1 Tax=Bordetella genomosp. 13 TaxID=463040 RepID=UPI0011A9CC6F|nr:response regulator transcription factor [Bordetella genomosp. 13]